MILHNTVLAFQPRLERAYDLARRGLERTKAPPLAEVVSKLETALAYYAAGRWSFDEYDKWIASLSVMLKRAAVASALRKKIRYELRGLAASIDGPYGVGLRSAINEALATRHPIYENFTLVVGNNDVHVEKGKVGTPTSVLTGEASTIARVLTGMSLKLALTNPQDLRLVGEADLEQLRSVLAPTTESDNLSEVLAGLRGRALPDKFRNWHANILINASSDANHDLNYRLDLAAQRHGVATDDVTWLMAQLRAPAPTLVKPTISQEVEKAEEADAAKGDKPSVKQPSLEDEQQVQIATLWEAVCGRLPRAMERVFRDWTAVWDTQGKLHQTLVFPTRGAKVQFGVNASEQQIVAPMAARNWPNQKLADGMVEAAMLHFLNATNLMNPAKMDAFLAKYISEKEIITVIENLNELAQITIKEEQEAHTLLDLDNQLKSRFADPARATHAAQWLAEHSESLLAKLTDKRMIPLFTRWLIEAMQDIVANRRVRADVPQVIVDFIMKTMVLTGKSAWRRDVLHQNVEQLTEIRARLAALKQAGISGIDEIAAEINTALQALPR